MAGTGDSDVPKPSLTVLQQFSLCKAYLCKPADLLTILFTLKSSDDIERPSHFSWWSSLLKYEKCIFHRLLLISCSCLCYLSCHMLSPCDSLPGTICTASALAKLLQAVIMIEPWALPLKSKMKNLNRPLSELLSYMWNWCQNIRAAPRSNWYGYDCMKTLLEIFAHSAFIQPL